jgi:hypothetical protein
MFSSDLAGSNANAVPTSAIYSVLDLQFSHAYTRGWMRGRGEWMLTPFAILATSQTQEGMQKNRGKRQERTGQGRVMGGN